MAVSQFIPALMIGYLYTYWAPLGGVISVSLIREAVDDFRRYQRDKEVNSSRYVKLTAKGQVSVASSALKVGDVVYVEKGQRVPADMILLKTTEHSGACFIRTDQLDGETDWKLRLAVPCSQKVLDNEILALEASVYAEKPQKDIHSFIGKFTNHGTNYLEEPLGIENTIWSNTIVASGTALGLVIYTGPECRATMNNSKPRTKNGLIDLELNDLTKILILATVTLSIVMVSLKGFEGPWYIYLFRFVLLFSYLIPISLRVNLDIGKIFYSLQIQNDKDMPGTVARSTTIPEELGRIAYLLSDKTGTLTKNIMVFKKLHLGTVSFNDETFDEIIQNLRNYYTMEGAKKTMKNVRKSAMTRVVEAVKALSLCHNVTPVYDSKDNSMEEATEADQDFAIEEGEPISYQASSPDEVALVHWSEQVGFVESVLYC